MPAALPLQTKISKSSQRSRDPRVIRTQYGNGYEQRATDGINPLVDKWTITWENINSSEYSTVQTALDTALGVDYFTWTAFGDASSKKWVQAGPVQLVPQSGALFTLSCPFTQVFDL